MGLSAGKLEDSYFKTDVKLGTGSFGTVWRGLNKSNQEAVAIKEICKKSSITQAELYQKEITIMSSINHTNILQLIACFEEDTFYKIVLEYCDGGDLADKIRQLGNTITTAMAANWTQQVVEAVHALHGKHIVHLDIKPGNFLIAHQDCNAGPNCEVLKLADFGLATVLPKDQKLFFRCGTPAFKAPEQHEIDEHEGYSKPADMWAVGIMLYMFLHGGRHPFMSGGSVNRDKLSQGLRPKPQSCSISFKLWRNSDMQSGKELYRRLLRQLPDLRPTAHDSLGHVFLIA